MDLIWVSALPTQSGEWYWWKPPDTGADPTIIETSTEEGVLYGTCFQGPYAGTTSVSSMGGEWGGFLLVGAIPIERPV